MEPQAIGLRFGGGNFGGGAEVNYLHGIGDVGIHARGNESFRWIIREGRAITTVGKFEHSTAKDQC